MNQPARAVAHEDAEDRAAEPHRNASADNELQDETREAPSDFRMPISRVRCSTAMYMERQTTAKPMTTPIPITTWMNEFRAGDVLDGDQRQVFLHGVDGVILELLLEQVDDGVDIGRAGPL